MLESGTYKGQYSQIILLMSVLVKEGMEKARPIFFSNEYNFVSTKKIKLQIMFGLT